MRQDVKSNCILAEELSAASRGPAVVNGAGVDHADGSSVTFFFSLGNYGAAGVVVIKLQYSDDNSTWTDYPPPDAAGNDDFVTMALTTGSGVLNVPNPIGRYTRTVTTITNNAVIIGIVSVLGPARSVAA